MIRDHSADERISAWLHQQAPEQLPDRVLTATFDRTRAARQRQAFPGWRPDRLLMGILGEVHRTRQRARVGRWFNVGLASAASIVAVALVGIIVLPRLAPSLGDDPSLTPIPGATLEPISLVGQVAFERTVDGNSDIFLMNLDRTGLVQLTDDPRRDTAPSWSADGSRIVFTRGFGTRRDVFVMNADGTGETRLTTSLEAEGSADFSPDGSEIVFLRYVDPTAFDLFVMDADGSNQRLLWHEDGTFADSPRWSSDGQSIYFTRDESSGGQYDIVQLSVASGDLVVVTATQGDDSTFDISPDGARIAFQSDRPPGGLFLMDIDGSNVRHLTGSWLKGYPVSWGPDADYLVYGQEDGWLYLISATQGGQPTRWAEGDGAAAWRPVP